MTTAPPINGRAAASDPEPDAPRQPTRPSRRIGTTLRAFLGYTAVAACVLYSAFAWYSAAVELLSILRLTPAPPGRAASPLFVVHAFAGGITLTAGAVQLKLARRLLRTRPGLHRTIGRTYVATAGITAAGGLGTAALFDVGAIAKAAFFVWATGWAAATVLAVRHARAGRFAEHRRWMIRGFALAAVFLTFDVWRTSLAGIGLPRSVAYSLGLLLTAAIDLAVAELWIRARGGGYTSKPARATIYRITDG
jgi:hypothetical protein